MFDSLSTFIQALRMTWRTQASSPLVVAGALLLPMLVGTCIHQQATALPPTSSSPQAAGDAVADAQNDSETQEPSVNHPTGSDAQPAASTKEVRLRHPPQEGVLGFDIALQDKDGHSMDALHRALKVAADKKGKARLLFYGASHVASDFFTGYIRKRLQSRFGDAGHGFIMPAHPWPSYRHLGIVMKSSKKLWQGHRVRANSTEVDDYGFAGMAVSASDPKAYAEIQAVKKGVQGRRFSQFELFYLQQPDGGSLDIRIDQRPMTRLNTRANAKAPGYWIHRLSDAFHRIELRVVGDAPVRLFGAAVERDEPGVVVDTVGINGARARYHLLWNDALYRDQLVRRQPNLIALAYGTNESGDDIPLETYEGRLRQVLQRIRAILPNASCLLIGPSDRPVRIRQKRTTRYEDRPRTQRVNNTQRRVAVEMGCAFFDVLAFQGGPLSMLQWVEAKPPYGAPDHIHFTRRGYERLGEVLLDAIMEGFERP